MTRPHGNVPAPRYPVGTVVQSKNPVESKQEAALRQRLAEAGLDLHRGRSAVQCGFDPTRGNWPVLTPDMLIRHSKVCVEYDTAATHTDDAADAKRDRLLADAGWTVVRLRTGGLPPLGDHDVTSDSAGVTVPAVAALVEAVGDAMAGRPGKHRHIEKNTSAAPRKKSPLGALGEHKYYENAFYAAWGSGADRVQYVLMAGGRYLALEQGFDGPAFVADVGLHELPRTEWRDALTAALTERGAEWTKPLSRFPWGDDLFIGDVRFEVSRKFNAGGSADEGTCNLPPVLSWTDTSVTCADGVTVELHPAAVTLGWRLTALTEHTGYRGPYQRYRLERTDR